MQHDTLTSSSHSTISLREYIASKRASVLPEFISFPTPLASQDHSFTDTTDHSHISNATQFRPPSVAHSYTTSSVWSLNLSTSSTFAEDGNSTSQLQGGSGESSISLERAAVQPRSMAHDDSSMNCDSSASSAASAVHQRSEVRSMLSFLRSQGKGSSPHRQNILVVQREIILPLSANTFGEMQQDSQEQLVGQSQEFHSAIPIRELDDPPDLPSL